MKPSISVFFVTFNNFTVRMYLMQALTNVQATKYSFNVGKNVFT